MYMFCIYLRTNSDLCHLQYKLIGFYKPHEKCSLRGTTWVFNWSSLLFVFKGLILYYMKVYMLILHFMIPFHIALLFRETYCFYNRTLNIQSTTWKWGIKFLKNVYKHWRPQGTLKLYDSSLKFELIYITERQFYS